MKIDELLLNYEDEDFFLRPIKCYVMRHIILMELLLFIDNVSNVNILCMYYNFL